MSLGAIEGGYIAMFWRCIFRRRGSDAEAEAAAKAAASYGLKAVLKFDIMLLVSIELYWTWLSLRCKSALGWLAGSTAAISLMCVSRHQQSEGRVGLVRS